MGIARFPKAKGQKMNAVQYREAVEMARELCQLCGETPDAGDGINVSDSSFSGIVYANAETKATGPRIDFGYTPYPESSGYGLSDLMDETGGDLEGAFSALMGKV